MVEARETSAGETIPAEMVAVAEISLSTFEAVKGEIDSRMADFRERYDGIRTLIRENVQCTENPAGVLTMSYMTYMKCLSCDIDRFDKLIQQDKAHWAENMEMIKSQALEIDEEMKQDGKEKFTVKKLPLWDQDLRPENEKTIDFEWPTEKMIKYLPDDIKLHAIEFTSI